MHIAERQSHVRYGSKADPLSPEERTSGGVGRDVCLVPIADMGPPLRPMRISLAPEQAVSRRRLNPDRLATQSKFVRRASR